MTLISVLQLLGGIGLFLYGMNLLGTSLEKLAGAGLEKTLEKLTNNRFKGIALGTVVTGVIQSSSATVVMVIGFLNAGIMKLPQAISVIMGANIGTTVTGQILRLGDISAADTWLSLLKPASFAPVCIAIGALVLLISKKRKSKDKASILMGFGILFFGMTTMEAALAPLSSSAEFQHLFSLFTNPLLGILVGALVTIILQSSSASVGILQAVSSTGSITFAMAAPIIMGQNIGKCATVVLASIGTNKKAKRAVYIDVLMNVLGAAIFLAAIYGYQSLVGFSFWDNAVTRGNIADFHTLFNIGTCVLMLPLCNALVEMSKKMLKDHEISKIDEELMLLDDNFLKTPSLALQQCKKVIISMGEAVTENFDIASKLLEAYDEKQMEFLQENEKFLDKTETVLGEYLIKITERGGMNSADNRLATEIMHSVGDFERIGDYCVNIAEVAEYNNGQHIVFSPIGTYELHHITAAVHAAIDMTVEAYRNDDSTVSTRLEPLEETVDMLVEMLKEKHVERLQRGQCTTQSGISFVELLTNFERISDHCSNVGMHLTQRILKIDNFDIHDYLNKIHESTSEDYLSLCRHYEELYCDPVR